MRVVPYTPLAMIQEGPLTFAYVKSKIPNDDFFDLSQIYREWLGSSVKGDPEWLNACRAGVKLPADVIRLFALIVKTTKQLRCAIERHGITYDRAETSFAWQRIHDDFLTDPLPFSNEDALLHHVLYQLHGKLRSPVGQNDRLRVGNGIQLLLLDEENEPTWSLGSRIASLPCPGPGCIDWEAIAGQS